MQIHMVNYMLRKAKKESRVSTLTLAQSDYRSDDTDMQVDSLELFTYFIL